ncbi:MAG: hypothetical protein R6U20_02410 [Longimonas sp.]|uniref:hypothetical protein n=1 Tax=Longimonas sp. TaxID=2039626 RepID=UPI003976B774
MPTKTLHTTALATITAALAVLLLMPTHAMGQGFDDPLEEVGNGQDGSNGGDTPFVHGLTIGAGINTYQGDLSRNPNNNILKYVSAANPAVFVRADRRFGTFQQFGLNAELQYNRISGSTTSGGDSPLEFSNNLLALDFTADYDVPYVRQGLFRVFLGGGPLFMISPSYSSNFPEESEKFDPLGSRVTASFVAGVSFFDTFRIGVRVPTSDFLDGHTGIDGVKRPDYVGFVGVTHRFNFR